MMNQVADLNGSLKFLLKFYSIISICQKIPVYAPKSLYYYLMILWLKCTSRLKALILHFLAFSLVNEVLHLGLFCQPPEYWLLFLWFFWSIVYSILFVYLYQHFLVCLVSGTLFIKFYHALTLSFGRSSAESLSSSALMVMGLKFAMFDLVFWSLFF